MGKKNKKCSFEGCNKKLKITSIKCRCGMKFCDKHRLPETHSCSFDFKKNRTQYLINKGLGGGQFNKVLEI